MRILSEAKLAIDDLYERIKDQNKKRVPTKEAEAAAEQGADQKQSVTDLKSWFEKLHALQFRILDLDDITSEYF